MMASWRFLAAIFVVVFIPVIRADEEDIIHQATTVLTECGERDLMECLGVKLATALDRASRMSQIDLADGVAFVANKEADITLRGSRALDEVELTNSLEREPEDRSGRLIDMLLDAASRFFKTHTLQFKLPETNPAELKRALEEEGRGRKKQLRMILPILMGLGLKMVTLLPIGIGLVGFMALKALVISKIALVIAAVISLQKLLGQQSSGWAKNQWTSQQQPSAGWASTNTGGWSSGSGSSNAGYYRSFDAGAPMHIQDAQQMAYGGQEQARR